MKTVFIVNKEAGQGKGIDRLIENIKLTAKELECDVEIYRTKSVGDATEYVKKCCVLNPKTRFIACGGDGTLSEVVNGAFGFETAEIGVIPIGTGNDFCRNFDADFKNIKWQILGNTTKCDIIKFTNAKKNGYCVNMANIGFDCNVADMTAIMKKKPFISGPLAYFISIFIMLIKKRGANLKIEVDGKTVHNGALLLTSIANGCYCGGGIKSNPKATVMDGLINVNVIKNVSRLKFITLLPYYMKGTHINLKKIDKYVLNIDCKKVKITPNDEKTRFSNDGEITDTKGIEFEILEKAINFVMPKEVQNENTICREQLYVLQ